MLPHKSGCTNVTDIWMEAPSNPMCCTLSRGAAQEPPCAGKAPCSADNSTHALAQWLSYRTSCTWALNVRAHISFLPIIYSLTLQNPLLLKSQVLAAKIIMKLQINGSNFKLSSKWPSLIFRKSLKNGIKGEREILKNQNYSYTEDARAFFSQCCTTC